jgi:hypothetical protein
MKRSIKYEVFSLWEDKYVFEHTITADNEDEAKELAKEYLDELLLDESYTRKRKVDKESTFVEVTKVDQIDV